RRRAEERQHPLLVALGGLEVVAYVAHESHRSRRGEEHRERQGGERERQPAAHRGVVHAERQKGRSVSLAEARKRKPCSPGATGRSSLRHPGAGGAVGGTSSPP